MARICWLMAVAALGAAVRGADTETISLLVAQLGDDSYERREAASRALEEFGAPVVLLLHELRERNRDPEVRSRLDRVIILHTPLVATIANPEVTVPAAEVKRIGEIKATRVSWRGASLVLDGSPSERQGTLGPLSYTWTQVGEPSVALRLRDLHAPRLPLAIRGSGEFRFQLVVSDGVRTSKPAFATVTVSGSKNSQWLAQATLDAIFSFEEYESARAAKREFTLPDATAEYLLENER